MAPLLVQLGLVLSLASWLTTDLLTHRWRGTHTNYRNKDILDNLGGAQYWCRMMRPMPFCKMAPDPASAHIAAFITPFGSFQPKVMMQGLETLRLCLAEL